MSAGPEARLFVAVELPVELALELRAWARESAVLLQTRRGALGMRVLEPESLHLTLCFLGARPAAEIDGLAAALAESCAGHRSCELAIGMPVWLPPRRPRALAVEVKDLSGALAGLQGDVERALGGGGRDAPRRYRPHVTVARARGGAGRPPQTALPATPQAGFSARRVALVRSRPQPAGARYETQASVTLSGPA